MPDDIEMDRRQASSGADGRRAVAISGQVRSVLAFVGILAVASGGLPGSVRASSAAPQFAVRDTSNFNSDYLYALTRRTAEAGLDRAAVLCLAPMTLVVDTALLPIATLMGLIDHD